MQNKHIFAKALYQSVAVHLPASYAVGGRIWKAIRGYLASRFLCECGKNINIEQGARFSSRVSIGNGSGIGVRAYIQGETRIGDHVMMGPEVMIFTRNHSFKRTDITIQQQGADIEKPVLIGDDVWIGARVILLPGVHIGNGVVIGAGAVVTKSFSDGAVIGGNPARVIRYRDIPPGDKDGLNE